MYLDFDTVKYGLLGVATGDALGIPVEFTSRRLLKNNPVRDMQGYGTYNLPPGTWSDDSSLTFCTVESLINGYDPEDMAGKFLEWYRKEYWTARGDVFDIGMSTRKALIAFENGKPAIEAGGNDESSNGNGSLMRALPLIYHLRNQDKEERFRTNKEVSSITHGHIRAVIACFYYVEFGLGLLSGEDKFEVYKRLQSKLPDFLMSMAIEEDEINKFDRLLNGDINQESEENISSTGYVLHTLEASIWCLLNTNNYTDAVLKAVNLGNDTDTVAAVTGGLAGILYKYIPEKWLYQLSRKDDIIDLAERYFIALNMEE